MIKFNSNHIVFIFTLLFTFAFTAVIAGIGDGKGPFDSNSTNETNSSSQTTSNSPFQSNADYVLDDIPDPTPPGDAHDPVPLDGMATVLLFLGGTILGFFILLKQQVYVLNKQ